MKTDDYKQELRLSATLHGRNTKKNLRSKKHQKDRLRSFAIFSELPRGPQKVGAPNCAKKGPPFEGSHRSYHDITLVTVVRMLQYLSRTTTEQFS
jgi:hypothetical protein